MGYEVSVRQQFESSTKVHRVAWDWDLLGGVEGWLLSAVLAKATAVPKVHYNFRDTLGDVDALSVEAAKSRVEMEGTRPVHLSIEFTDAATFSDGRLYGPMYVRVNVQQWSSAVDLEVTIQSSRDAVSRELKASFDAWLARMAPEPASEEPDAELSLQTDGPDAVPASPPVPTLREQVVARFTGNSLVVNVAATLIGTALLGLATWATVVMLGIK